MDNNEIEPTESKLYYQNLDYRNPIEKVKFWISIHETALKSLKETTVHQIIEQIQEENRNRTYVIDGKYQEQIDTNSLSFKELLTEKKASIKSEIKYHKKEIKLLKRKKIELENNPPEKTKLKLIDKRNFENNFDNVEQNKVYDYFRKELFDKNYLNEETLFEYLKLAFQDKSIPKEKFNFIRFKTKQTLIKIFYNYYKLIAAKPHGKQPEYIKLLTDYFNGFDFDTVKTNFNK